MKIGKVPNDILETLIGKYSPVREEVLVGPGVGRDYAAIDTGGEICVLSSDPITAAGKNAGRLAVHVAVNDAAACGADPIGILTTILMPENTPKNKLMKLIAQISETCGEIGIDVIGGHTEVTGAVNKIIIVSTIAARVKKGKMIHISGAKPGDSIIMTKTAGLEGTSIIAFDNEKYIRRHFGSDFLKTAQDCINKLSVLKEGRIAAENSAHSMHDITEGGLQGAVWEMCAASGTGAEIIMKKVSVSKETAILCRHFKIDALKLISSGSMLIACEDGVKMTEVLESNGIAASVIGTMTETQGDINLIKANGKRVLIMMPETDEIYKIAKKRLI